MRGCGSALTFATWSFERCSSPLSSSPSLRPPLRRPRIDTLLVSRLGTFLAGADGDSANASTSPDGRYIAFESGADNLSTENNDSFTGIYLRDTVLGTTTFVSRASGATGAAADDNATKPGVSADGHYVVFSRGRTA